MTSIFLVCRCSLYHIHGDKEFPAGARWKRGQFESNIELYCIVWRLSNHSTISVSVGVALWSQYQWSWAGQMWWRFAWLPSNRWHRPDDLWNGRFDMLKPKEILIIFHWSIFVSTFALYVKCTERNKSTIQLHKVRWWSNSWKPECCMSRSIKS